MAVRGWQAALGVALLLATGFSSAHGQAAKDYLGFDQNLYPGDAVWPVLHHEFAYTGYWLNNPPEMTADPWAGKRALIRRAGLGFLLLFNGRLDKALQRDATALGASDAADAVKAARREGFPQHALIFLDMEEGGRMLPEQLAYIGAWLRGVRAAGFRAGVYCSGIEAPDGQGQTITTARDLQAHFHGTPLWVANDQCPPSPGCVAHALPPKESQFAPALVWQFAQSPERRRYTRACARTYPNHNCYAQGLPESPETALDLDTSTSADPSGGR